jgi:hypothetical protein
MMFAFQNPLMEFLPTFSTTKLELGAAAHSYNSSYAEGRGQEDVSLKSAWANSS